MGYPVVTRLGINQFWYKHWYTDTFYKQNVQQDLAFERFVMLYINYGTTFKNNVFIHEYWYSKPSKFIRTLPLKSYMKHYRRFYYSNNTLGIEHSFLLRNHSGEYFPMRCWILKYNSWVILSLKFFKPLKIKNSSYSRIRRKTSVSSATSDFNYKTNNNSRLTIFYTYLLNQIKNNNNAYYF
jgi:hypothetical protein